MTSVRSLFANAQGSAIRELAGLAQEPDMISLAGGMPDPALLPLEAIREAYARALSSDDRALLQYGPTDGLPACKQAVSALLRDILGPQEPADWVMTSGSQQAIDLVARTLLDPGDAVVVEDHAYPAALQAFRFCEARIAGLACDEQGLLPEALREFAATRRVRAIYLVPTFGNPTGVLMGAERRLALLRAAADAQAVVIEDDPYRSLAFEDAAALPPTLHQLEREHRTGADVVYLTSFSKTVAPALRVGAVLASPTLRRAVVLAKQAADIHSGTLDQGVLAQLLGSAWLPAHLATLRTHYAAKGLALHAALQAHVGDLMTWQAPRGGMFIWGTLRNGAAGIADWKPIFRRHGVLFVPGREFSACGVDAGHLRLSFANPAIPRLAEGAARLSRVLREALAA